MLRSSNELVRYDVEAADGAIGRLEDFYFDEESWSVRSIAIDTDGLIQHGTLLLPAAHVREIRLPEETLVLEQTRAELEDAALVQPPTGASAGSGSRVHSANTIRTYAVHDGSGPIGTLDGLLVETTTWSIRYLILISGSWLTGKPVLLSPLAVASIDEASGVVRLNVARETIAGAPAYDATSELAREWEAFLHDYYGWPHYWR